MDCIFYSCSTVIAAAGRDAAVIRHSDEERLKASSFVLSQGNDVFQW